MTTIEASAGPWWAETIEEDSTHCYIYSVGSDCVVATLDRREDASSKFSNRCIADATLMAAAPMMRDAIEDILAQLKGRDLAYLGIRVNALTVALTASRVPG